MIHGRWLLCVTLVTIAAPALRGQVPTATGARDVWSVGNDVTVIDVDSILRTTPAATVTDILETRVPGLVVLHGSGTPGDASHLRLRGASSVTHSNDPLVILNGVRLSTNRPADPSVNLAGTASGGTGFAAPSPLDQIDPHGIATLEVLNGPSATALYGADAANGVVVITMKQGSAGATHWSLSLGGGESWIPGNWPKNDLRFGHDVMGGPSSLCPVSSAMCVVDSIAAFQALDDPRYTLFDHGSDADVSLSLSGGGSRLTYALTGGASNETGPLRLPALEAAHFQQLHGVAPPNWMRNPDRYVTQSGVATLTAAPWHGVGATLTSALFSGDQRRSSLEQSIPLLYGAYVNADTAALHGFVPEYLQRATSSATRWSNALGVTWAPASWLPLDGTVGIDRVTRRDEILLPAGYSADADSIGRLQRGDGTSTTYSAALTTVLPFGGARRPRIATAVGLSAVSESDVVSTANHPVTTPQIGSDTHQRWSPPTIVSGFVEPRVAITPRLFLTPGVRWDADHTAGATTVTAFPRVAASWIALTAPQTSRTSLAALLPFLRLRGAYGVAGAVANSGALTSGAPMQVVPTDVAALPGERSREVEGGFDAGWWEQRVALDVTAYRKTTSNAHFAVPAVGPASLVSGVASVRNTGTEIGLTAQLLQSAPIGWTVALTYGHNDNVVTGVTPLLSPAPSVDVFGTRVAAGAALFGRWAIPVVGYSDVNNDGVLTSGEVQLGDSAVYLGPELPRTSVGVNSALSFFGGRLVASTTLEYQNGLSQIDGAAITTSVSGTTYLSNQVNTPGRPLAQQADAVAFPATPIGAIQTVHVLRWSALALTYTVPQDVSRRLLHLPSVAVALQGRNLATRSNYHGKDPSVNSFTLDNAVSDQGEIPLLRSWGVRVTLGG